METININGVDFPTAKILKVFPNSMLASIVLTFQFTLMKKFTIHFPLNTLENGTRYMRAILYRLDVGFWPISESNLTKINDCTLFDSIFLSESEMFDTLTYLDMPKKEIRKCRQYLSKNK